MSVDAVVMTAWRRPEYLAETLSSWEKVRGVRDQPFVVNLDPSERQSQMIRTIRWFPWATLRVNDRRLGVLSNPWTALDRAFLSGSRYVLLAEEDVTVSDDILEYHQHCAGRYADDDGVLAVCSFTSQDGHPTDVHLQQRFCPLIWGTWHDRWYDILRDTWDHDYSTGVGGMQAGWDWNINRILRDKGLHCLYPVGSRSQHIGFHGGVHTTPQTFVESRSASFVAHRPQIDWPV